MAERYLGSWFCAFAGVAAVLFMLFALMLGVTHRLAVNGCPVDRAGKVEVKNDFQGVQP
jgi:hypothetical protein